MMSKMLLYTQIMMSFLPFMLFLFLNNKANVKKEVRNRQYPMPFVAIIYSIVLAVFLNKLSALCLKLVLLVSDLFERLQLSKIADFIQNLYAKWGIYLALVLFNTLAIIIYVSVKRVITAILKTRKVKKGSLLGSFIEVFYEYDEQDDKWYIKEHFGQARTYIKIIYYSSTALSVLALLISCALCEEGLISAPFYPIFAPVIVGELAFFIDGLRKEEAQSSTVVQTDKSKHIAMYPLLRKPLVALFGDKLSAEGTTVNNSFISTTSVEDILANLEKTGGHIGENYAAFIRKKTKDGLKPNVDYVRSGYDLAVGKSLLFNTPFYDKLNPYVFYAMNRALLTGGKVLIVLGRHTTEDDLYKWCKTGMKEVSNIPDLWKIEVLSNKAYSEENEPHIGIISRSGVHDLDIHKNNLPFLKKISFVMVIEPSRLMTTAQIGLNLLIKCCGDKQPITYCSVDRNCDGLVDALSHALMTNITEVSATEYPRGISSYMYWKADNDYLQHRILPGVSRYLGMGTELSMVALKNQIKKATWYGGEAFPIMDAHWIAKQYYYDLLNYAQLPTNQETFDKCFQASFNMCNEKVNDYSFVVVEDDRNNLFETRRNFATIAEEQGFINVISSEYMLREYMANNTEIFTADAKAIPYITADYAKTKRNAILSLCLLLCIDSVQKETLHRQMFMMNIDTENPVEEIWEEICLIFSDTSEIVLDRNGVQILSIKKNNGKMVSFERDKTIIYKREYSVETGRFESVYTIENDEFARLILDDLQNASYIAEQENKDLYIGTELKGHVYQKYLPGQFFTLNGKYYEMVSTAIENRILVRRASEHIGGRLAYRQVRNYKIQRLTDSQTMGALKSINNIDIHYQYADFSVETPGYWKLNSYNDFDNGILVQLNGVPNREYHHKQILKLDFSKFGERFTDEVRMTLTNLLNEVFVTLFAENQPFISAITPGAYDAPMTYSLDLEDVVDSGKCIYIVEDSQLDIGLLVAVERNASRIFQIISDYLSWNEEQIADSIRKQNEPEEKKELTPIDVYEEEAPAKKKCFFKKIVDFFKKLFKKKDKKVEVTSEETEVPAESEKLEEAETLEESEKSEESEMPEEVSDEAAESEESKVQEVPTEDVKEEVKQKKGFFKGLLKKKKKTEEISEEANGEVEVNENE